jgi:ABC-type transport system involved in multi-copper enzyme maturation permease subunit
MIYTLMEAHRRRIWFPFLLGAIVGVLMLLWGFGILLRPNEYADNIITTFFYFWSLGTAATALCLGAASIPIERETLTLFTLPIGRWDLLFGKLCGNCLLVTAIHLAGYLISIALAFHANLPVAAYSVVSLFAAVSLSFVMLCFSIPLGVVMSPVLAGSLTVGASFVLSYAIFRAFINWQSIEIIQDAEVMRHAFFNRPVDLWDYLPGFASLAQGLTFFLLIGFMFRRTEAARPGKV